MNLRPALVPVLLLSALILTGCNSARRSGKDLTVLALSPAIILYGAGTDGFSDAQGLREGTDAGPFLEVLSMPFTVVISAVKHTLYCGIYGLDFFAWPVYGVAELMPNGPEVEPLDYYTGTWFDLPTDGQGTTGTDPSSGEVLDR